MSGIPFVGICSGGPLNGQKMARIEKAMEVFAPKYDMAGLAEDGSINFDEFEVCVAGVYEYSGYGLWSWQPTETK